MTHKTYDLEPITETSVWVLCADCREPIGVATILAWGLLAEAHYREKVSSGG